jgi:serine/threonine protein kinase
VQNLLLSTDDDTAVLKIADFGFARSILLQLFNPVFISPNAFLINNDFSWELFCPLLSSIGAE